MFVALKKNPVLFKLLVNIFLALSDKWHHLHVQKLGFYRKSQVALTLSRYVGR